MADFEIKKDGDKILAFTPYNKDFVSRIKLMGGKWQAGQKAWAVPADMIDSVRDLMTDVYGRDDRPVKTVTVQVTALEQISGDYRQGITLFGKDICHAWGRDSGATVESDVSFLKGKPDSSGSRNNWFTYIEKDSVFIIRNVPEAALKFDTGFGDRIEWHVVKNGANEKDKLLAEKEQLEKRLAEINNRLAELEG